jgi:hypothetical protein
VISITGCETMLFNHIKKEAVNKPLIIYSEELYEYPKETIENLCQQINIPYSEASLGWNKLDDNFNVKKALLLFLK